MRAPAPLVHLATTAQLAGCRSCCHLLLLGLLLLLLLLLGGHALQLHFNDEYWSSSTEHLL
jgi:hypothetical protein